MVFFGLMDILSDGIELTLFLGMALAFSVIIGAIVATLVMFAGATGIKKIFPQKEKDNLVNDSESDNEELTEKEKELV